MAVGCRRRFGADAGFGAEAGFALAPDAFEAVAALPASLRAFGEQRLRFLDRLAFELVERLLHHEVVGAAELDRLAIAILLALLRRLLVVLSSSTRS